MKSIAITGNIGSGKSTVMKRIASEITNPSDFVFESMDSMVHALYEANSEFQWGLMNLFGTCDRREISKIVFADAFKRKQLEFFSGAFLIPMLRGYMQRADQSGIKFYVIEVPMLFELGLQCLFDYSICVYADDIIRLNRVMERDKKPEELVWQIMASQMQQDIKKRMCDLAVNTNHGACHAVAEIVEVIRNDL
jgi:dephospho-CoA kinase